MQINRMNIMTKPTVQKINTNDTTPQRDLSDIYREFNALPPFSLAKGSTDNIKIDLKTISNSKYLIISTPEEDLYLFSEALTIGEDEFPPFTLIDIKKQENQETTTTYYTTKNTNYAEGVKIISNLIQQRKNNLPYNSTGDQILGEILELVQQLKEFKPSLKLRNII